MRGGERADRSLFVDTLSRGDSWKQKITTNKITQVTKIAAYLQFLLYIPGKI